MCFFFHACNEYFSIKQPPYVLLLLKNKFIYRKSSSSTLLKNVNKFHVLSACFSIDKCSTLIYLKNTVKILHDKINHGIFMNESHSLRRRGNGETNLESLPKEPLKTVNEFKQLISSNHLALEQFVNT